MRNISLSLTRVALAMIVAGLGACADNSSTPTAPTDPSLKSSPPADISVAVASIRLRCERRANRSKISVDGSGLVPRAGNFRARVTASGGTVTSTVHRAVAGDVEIDFDSNPNDIRAGATRIAANFITARTGPDVVARILNAGGQVVATQGADCTVQ
ncbi:MAG TPA: hypothetical protein VLK88_16945 [Gemmatimonadales bacterium]|nr:hypothetical protein [Gemmatimonadales bacterium]